MKKLVVFLVLLLSGASASAVQLISIITGADMAGMEVTATFSNGSSETATWIVTDVPATPVPAGSPVGDFEVYAGGAFGNGWSLTQRGETFGDVDLANNQFFGQWTLSNQTGVTMDGLVIDAFIPLDSYIVFDNIFGVEHTPTSDVGRPFTPNSNAVTGVYSNPYSDPDLWGTLALSFAGGFADGSTLNFMADTDKIPVPGTFLLVLVWPALRIARNAAMNAKQY